MKDHRLFPSLSLVLLLAVLPLLAGCGNGQASPDAGAAPSERTATRGETLHLEEQRFEDVIQLTGTVEALNDATLSAQPSGTVVALEELGTYVEAGEAVAQLDPAEERAAVAQAEAQLASAKAQYQLALDTYERRRPLYQDSIISAAEFQQVKAQLAQAEAARAQAKAALAQAQQRLANTRVTTPFAGTVEEHFVDEGEQVNPGRQIARVVNTRRVKTVTGVPERYANDIEVGAPVRLNFTAYNDIRRDTAEVTFVGRTIDPESRTFAVEVELPNPEGTLKPEMVVQLYLTREVIEDALVVPRAAVVRDEEGTSVYVVARADSGAVARKRDVTVGAETGEQVVIASGVEAGAEVVVSGQDNLAPGEPVEVARQHELLETVGTTFGNGAE